MFTREEWRGILNKGMKNTKSKLIWDKVGDTSGQNKEMTSDELAIERKNKHLETEREKWVELKGSGAETTTNISPSSLCSLSTAQKSV